MTSDLTKYICPQCGRIMHNQGVENPKAKINEHTVRQIRQLKKKGLSNRKVADQVGLSPCQVSRIHRGQAWAHVKEIQ